MTFGIRLDNNEESTRSILNSNDTEFGQLTNSAQITLNFRGLGLPLSSYEKLTNLLSIVSQGRASCPQQVGGFCFLPGTCSTYDFITEYSFQVTFSGSDNYLVWPLSTIAFDKTQSGEQVCEVYVQVLNGDFDSQAIVFG
jgi:hypothetical protein